MINGIDGQPMFRNRLGEHQDEPATRRHCRDSIVLQKEAHSLIFQGTSTIRPQ